MLRRCLMFVCLLLLCGLVVLPTNSYALHADGDVAPFGSRDGVVNVGDALVVLRFALGLEIPTAEDILHADVAPLGVDGQPQPDGVINVGDALVILRKAVGLESFVGLADPLDIDNDGDGYTENQGDCNDALASINPAATEVCGDGIDQDCSGEDEVCRVRTLVIDLLGDGQVTSSTDSSLSCTDHCEYNSLQGQDIVLEATAVGGATFSHWTGCDSVNGALCTLVLDGDRSVFSNFSQPVSYQPGVVQLDAQAMALLLAQTETTLTFSSAIWGQANFAAGDVLVSTVVTDVAEALLRKVVSIDESGGQVLVTTTPATIEDVLQEGTLVSKTALSPENATISTARGVTLSRAVFEGEAGVSFEYALNEVLLDNDGNYATTNDQLKLSGTFTTTISLEAGLDVRLTGLEKFNLLMNSTTNTKLTVATSGMIGEKEFKKTLATYNLAPIVLGPVVIVPEIALVAKAKGSVAAGVSSSVEISAEVTGGVVYRKGSGWAPVGNVNPSFTFRAPTAQVTIGAKASAGPQLTTKIYGIAGPSVSLLGSLGLSGGMSVGGNTGYWCNLKAGVSASAGAKLSITSAIQAEASFTLLDYEKTLYSCPQLPALDSVNPLPPTNLQISSLLPTSATLTWDAATDNVAVTGYEIYQDGQLIDTNVIPAWYRAMRLVSGQNYCFRIRAYDAAGNRSPLSGEICAAPPITVANYTMSGTIHSGSNAGPALPGATVSIAGKSAVSSSTGAFTITGIPTGTYAFSVSKPGYDTYTNPAYYVGSNQGGLHFWLIMKPTYTFIDTLSESIGENASQHGDLATAGALAQGGTFLATGEYLSEVTIHTTMMIDRRARLFVLGTTSTGKPSGPVLWEGVDIIYPYSGNITARPNLPLEVGKLYFVGLDYGQFTSVDGGVTLLRANLNDPILEGKAWRYISPYGWDPFSNNVDIAAKIEMR